MNDSSLIDDNEPEEWWKDSEEIQKYITGVILIALIYELVRRPKR